MFDSIKLIEYLLNEVTDISDSDYNKLLQFIDVYNSNIKINQLYEVYNIYVVEGKKELLKQIDLKIDELRQIINIKISELGKLPNYIVSLNNNYIIDVYSELLDELLKLKNEIENNSLVLLNEKTDELKKCELTLIDRCMNVFLENALEFLKFFSESLIEKKDNEDAYFVNQSALDKIYILLSNSDFLNKAFRYFDNIDTKDSLIEEKLLISTMIKHQTEIKEFVKKIEDIEKSKRVIKNSNQEIVRLKSFYFPDNVVLKFIRSLLDRKKGVYKINIESLNGTIESNEKKIKENEEELSFILNNTNNNKLKEILNIYLQSKCSINQNCIFVDWNFSHLKGIYSEEFIKLLDFLTSSISTNKLTISDRVSIDDLNDRISNINDFLNKIENISFTEDEMKYIIYEKETIKNIYMLLNSGNKDNSKTVISVYILKAICDMKDLDIEQLKANFPKLKLDEEENESKLLEDNSYLQIFESNDLELKDKLEGYSNMNTLINERLEKALEQKKKKYKRDN